MRDMGEALPTLRRLRAFEAIAREGSVSAAAQTLRLSQPAVTQALNLLEAQLGAKLFERTADGSFLTEQGHTFRRRTARFFAQLGAAAATIRGTHEGLDALAAKIGSTQVRSLIAIWQAGTFRAAAHALCVSEPSLQRPARDLERLLEATLYKRSAAGLSVSPEGAELARRFALALGEIRSGAEEVGAASLSPVSLRVGVLALSPRTILADATGAVLRRHAVHKIEVVENSYDRLVGELRDGKLDLVFGALRAPPPFTDLVEEDLFDDPYAIVCRRGHPLAGLSHVDPHALAGSEWVFPTQGLPRRAVLNDMLAVWKIAPNVQIETSCLSTIVALLTSSDRLSLLSRWHIALDGHADLARVEGLTLAHPRRSVGLTTRAGWLPTPFQQAFLEELRSAAIRSGAARVPDLLPA